MGWYGILLFPLNEKGSYAFRIGQGMEEKGASQVEARLKIIVTVINREYVYVAANSHWLSATGNDPETLIGKTVADVWGRETFETVKPNLDRCLSGEEIRHESWINFPVLGRRYCEILYWPYGNRRRNAVVIMNDLTERKAMEENLRQSEQRFKSLSEEQTEELRKSEEKYRNIFLNASEGIFQITLNGRFISANPALARIHGYDSPEELMERVGNLKKLHVDRERTTEYVQLLVDRGFAPNFEFRMYRKDGTMSWVSVNARVVRDEKGKALYFEGIIQDITERKRVEEDLEIKSRKLEEANTALKVLLKHREEDKRELEERLVSNVKQLVLPYVEKLKKGRLDEMQRTELDFLDANLKEIVSPFLTNLRAFNFTPRQLEIMALIKQGKTTKEIAELLHVGKGAIDMHRFFIRKRLGLNKDKANLRSYLLSLG